MREVNGSGEELTVHPSCEHTASKARLEVFGLCGVALDWLAASKFIHPSNHTDHTQFDHQFTMAQTTLVCSLVLQVPTEPPVEGSTHAVPPTQQPQIRIPIIPVAVGAAAGCVALVVVATLFFVLRSRAATSRVAALNASKLPVSSLAVCTVPAASDDEVHTPAHALRPAAPGWVWDQGLVAAGSAAKRKGSLAKGELQGTRASSSSSSPIGNNGIATRSNDLEQGWAPDQHTASLPSQVASVPFPALPQQYYSPGQYNQQYSQQYRTDDDVTVGSSTAFNVGATPVRQRRTRSNAATALSSVVTSQFTTTAEASSPAPAPAPSEVPPPSSHSRERATGSSTCNPLFEDEPAAGCNASQEQEGAGVAGPQADARDHKLEGDSRGAQPVTLRLGTLHWEQDPTALAGQPATPLRVPMITMHMAAADAAAACPMRPHGASAHAGSAAARVLSCIRPSACDDEVAVDGECGASLGGEPLWSTAHLGPGDLVMGNRFNVTTASQLVPPLPTAVTAGCVAPAPAAVGVCSAHGGAPGSVQRSAGGSFTATPYRRDGHTLATGRLAPKPLPAAAEQHSATGQQVQGLLGRLFGGWMWGGHQAAAPAGPTVQTAPAGDVSFSSRDAAPSLQLSVVAPANTAATPKPNRDAPAHVTMSVHASPQHAQHLAPPAALQTPHSSQTSAATWGSTAGSTSPAQSHLSVLSRTSAHSPPDQAASTPTCTPHRHTGCGGDAGAAAHRRTGSVGDAASDAGTPARGVRAGLWGNRAVVVSPTAPRMAGTAARRRTRDVAGPGEC